MEYRRSRIGIPWLGRSKTTVFIGWSLIRRGPGVRAPSSADSSNFSVWCDFYARSYSRKLADNQSKYAKLFAFRRSFDRITRFVSLQFRLDLLRAVQTGSDLQPGRAGRAFTVFERVEAQYFVTISIKKEFCSKIEQNQYIPFTGSMMGRGLLWVQLVDKLGQRWTFMTSHLESTKGMAINCMISYHVARG